MTRRWWLAHFMPLSLLSSSVEREVPSPSARCPLKRQPLLPSQRHDRQRKRVVGYIAPTDDAIHRQPQFTAFGVSRHATRPDVPVLFNPPQLLHKSARPVPCRNLDGHVDLVVTHRCNPRFSIAVSANSVTG